MNTREETKKRLEIAKEIASQLRGIVRGVILGGSMGYGQNYSVTNKSDIDVLVVIDLENINKLESCEFFKTKISKEGLNAFKSKEINFFWFTDLVKGVEVNVFIYETKGYIDFCLLNKGLIGYKNSEPAETQTTYGFSGEKIEFKRNVKSYNKGFIYEKPALVEGKFWAGVPRMDFLYSYYVLHEENNFFTGLEKKVWKKVIEQLVREHGKNLDLDKTNVLNTHHIYKTTRQRLPKEVIKKIQERTKEELENMKKSNKSSSKF